MSSTQMIVSMTVQQLEETVQRAVASALASGSFSLPSASEGKSKKERKQKDPSAPKKEQSEGVKVWNQLVDQVWTEMKAEGWAHPETGKPAGRKDAMIEAQSRRSADDPEYAAKAAERRAKRDQQLASKAAPAEPAAAAPAKPEEAPAKPKKVLSPEHLAKLAAGREAAKAKKEAEKAALAAPAPAPAPAAVTAKTPTPKAAAAPVVPTPTLAAEEVEERWVRKAILGKKYLWNAANNHLRQMEEDGSCGAWVGILKDAKKNLIDRCPEPEEEGEDFEVEE